MVKKVKKISQMRNLGPMVEKDLNAAGIYSASEIKNLGPKKSFLKMLEGREKLGRSASCCNALYLYSFYGAIHDLDWREIPPSKKEEFKKFTKKLRESNRMSE
jgi:hypothetical protein